MNSDRPQFSYYLLAMITFVTCLIWEWSFVDLFNFLPSYGDVLEVVWGISWYSKSLFSNEMSPFFTPLVFHPLGWHTATLAHTPFFFTLGIPFYLIGGGAFAYNSLAVLSLLAAYLGSLKFFNLYLMRSLSVVGAAVYTFAGVRSACMGGGHLHILWASSLFPWLGWALWRFSHCRNAKLSWRYSIMGGLIWGIIINFSLYGIFFGALIFIVLGECLLNPKVIKFILVMIGIALLMGSISIIPYIMGNLVDQPGSFGISHVIHWGASANSLVAPFVFHPLNFFRGLSREIYAGPLDESGVANMGLSTSFLAIVGVIYLLRNKKRDEYGLIVLALLALLLSLGLFLKWDGEVVKFSIFQRIDLLLWRLGNLLKPDLFQSGTPPVSYNSGVPLPGFLFSVFIPFWESARTVSRYALVGYFSLVALAMYGIRYLPHKIIRYLFIMVWLLESLPPKVGQVPMPLVPHPAYQWLEDEPLPAGQGIVDIVFPTLYNSGETLYATSFHHTPTASGVGSFWPSYTLGLWKYLLRDEAFRDKETVSLLDSYGIRYIFLHLRGSKERSMWEMMGQNSALEREGCFEPVDGQSPWPYPICVAQVQRTQEFPINVILHDGWSVQEPWGVWAEGVNSEAWWFAERGVEYHLILEAFPNCVSNVLQSMSIKVNDYELRDYQWNDCETIQEEIWIPQDAITVGLNNVKFSYGYAVVPTDPESGEPIDSRSLSVGFSSLKISSQ